MNRVLDADIQAIVIALAADIESLFAKHDAPELGANWRLTVTTEPDEATSPWGLSHDAKSLGIEKGEYLPIANRLQSLVDHLRAHPHNLTTVTRTSAEDMVAELRQTCERLRSTKESNRIPGQLEFLEQTLEAWTRAR